MNNLTDNILHFTEIFHVARDIQAANAPMSNAKSILNDIWSMPNHSEGGLRG